MSLQFSKTFLAATGLLTTLCMTSLPSIANAAANSDTWIPANKSLTQVGETFTNNREDLIDDLEGDEIIFTNASDSNSLLFQCADNTLRAFITTKPQSWQDVLKKSSKRERNKSVLLSLDGAKATNIGKFTYKPTLKVLISHNTSQTVRLYNAVVNGQKITIDVGSKGNFDIIPPKPNFAFVDFGSQCGVGRHK